MRLLALLFALAALLGCSGTAVQRQAQVAHTTASLGNRALDVAVAAYDRAGRAALQAACCDRAAMATALERHRAGWRPFLTTWAVARAAHDAWATELEICRAAGTEDAGACGPSLGRLAAAALDALAAMRCDLRRISPGTDPIPGALSCGPVTPPTHDIDGGLP